MADVFRENAHLFLGSRLKRLAEQMQTDVIAVSRRAELSVQPGQYPLLAALDQYGPQTIGDLARSLGLSQPAITRNADRLLKAGLIVAGRGERDRRQRCLSLSPAGRSLIETSRREVWPLVDAAVKEVVEGLTGPLIEQIAEIEARLAARALSVRAADIADPRLARAADAELVEIAALINLAYRARAGAAVWTTEADYMDGQRTDEAMLRHEIAAKPDAALMVWRRPADDALRGCVWLEPERDGAWYLGALTVDPREHDRGLGRRLLAASEDWIRAWGGTSVTMTVVHLRDTLIAWYERRGYILTGETRPFPYDDQRFGKPRRDDLRFVVLRKHLA